MMSRLPFASALAAIALMGCGSQQPDLIELQPAQLEISSEFVEFGEIGYGETMKKTVTLSNTGDVSLGIVSIELATDDPNHADRGHKGAFKVKWDPADKVVPEGVGGDDDDDDEEAEEERRREDLPALDTADTAGGGGDTADTGEPYIPPETGDFALVLEPGARQPVEITFSPVVGEDNYDALIVLTGEEEEDEDEVIPADERIYRDLDTIWKMSYLHGYSSETVPNIVVTPRAVDFGFVWPGQDESRYVSIKNVGDGDLTLGAITKKDGHCSDGFEIEYAPPVGTIIEGDTATLMEVSYSPPGDTVSRAECRIIVGSNDADSPDVEVSFSANSGENAANVCPKVVIHDPDPGHVHQGWGPMEMELTVFDANQPPDTLVCKVRSILQLGAAIANCTPDTASGHMFLELPMDGVLETGLDVLVVQATDDSECTRKASIPVLINEMWPEDDDDGDGFAPDDPDYPDCDDTDPFTYPYAAERYDGRDNDCDLAVDEGTDGSDDDGDGFSEVAGDCDDNNANTYPGAPERQDMADNDCDGIIDENTSAYDDDGDGFSELELDCDDSDPNINPASPEICGDGIDNNCNGLKDSMETCVSLDSEPMIVGQINLSRTSIEEGETVQASVLLYEADGDTVTHQWESKNSEGTIDDPLSPSISWTGPAELPQDYELGNVYRLYYMARDDDDNQTWDFAEIWMYEVGDLSNTIVMQVPQESTCSHVPLAPFGFAAGFGLLFAAARRRREDEE